MKSLCNFTAAGMVRSKKPPTALLAGAVLVLAGVFWAESLPAQVGRESAGAESITRHLPEQKTLKNANQMEFLGAVCAAVRRRHANVPAITHAAVTARRDSTGEIVGMVLRCAGKINCEAIGAIVAAANAAGGDETRISDAAVAKAPNCAETIREALQRAAKTAGSKSAAEASAPPGPANGREEGFDPHEPLQLVCEGGTQRALRASLLEEFLKANPGATRGPCQTSPSSNR